ncbi:hypothetical protein M3212_03300 [Alkalihalobacillus oceani]|uniref:hypothetical protein n=1 Tax=Halalkalibacter oceani TaxID=1653776 RepID=UPI00203F7F4C|nr:hypothetical protein [Halalkalibacter oceani]MCM3759811.1 hypothetical protein [Halalkalibacter oceani]
MEEYFPLQDWIERNQLLRLTIIRPKIGRQTLHVRLISYDKNKQSLLFYDDDRKEVIHIVQNEIDQIEAED